MKVFKIKSDRFNTYIAKDMEDVLIFIDAEFSKGNQLDKDESFTVTAEDMSEDEYNNLSEWEA